MSKATGSGSLTSDQEAFLDEIRDVFEPWLESEQCRNHPATDFPEVNKRRRNDGSHVYRGFHLQPFFKYLYKATKQDHAVARFASALPHFVTHITKWEKAELKRDDPQLDELPRERKKVLEWLAARDPATDEVIQDAFDAEEEREKLRSHRMERLRTGGTGIILHGEQGTTKTTAMYWLVALIMQINQTENVIWQSTLDDTEWQVFGPWATVCIPDGIDVEVVANPYGREYRGVDPFEISMDDICRQVISYRDPEDLMDRLAQREPGQFYVVYPDPRFRKCQSITNYSYENIWEVDSSSDATDINHFWFALMQAIKNSRSYNDWTTLVADEAHKWLRQGKGNDEHDWWNKIDDWATYWGDARKKRLSCLLAIHKWHEVHQKVRDKVRWGATMNGEEFPQEAPLGGKNTGDQGLGDTCVWNSLQWNHVGYPDIKQHFAIEADFEVSYPQHELEKEAKS